VGYAEPAAGTSGGVWTSSGATATTVQGVSPRLADVAVLAEEGLVVASDSTDFAEGTIRVAQGEAESLGDVPAGADVAAPLVGSAVAVVHSAANGCATGSYVDADTGDANQAELAANAAGGLTPHQGPGLGLQEKSGAPHLLVTMRFSSAQTAQTQAAVRTRLTAGEAVGQGGTFAERFSRVDAEVDGDVALLDLRLASINTQALSDLGEGPLLFAWCGLAGDDT